MTTQLSHDAVTTQATVPATSAGGGLRAAFDRVRLVVQEMNYGARRVVEVQARPGVDTRPGRG